MEGLPHEEEENIYRKKGKWEKEWLDKKLMELCNQEKETKINKKKSKKTKKIITILLILISLTILGYISIIGGMNYKKRVYELQKEALELSIKNPPNLINPRQGSYMYPEQVMNPWQESYIGTLDFKFEWSVCDYADYYQIEIQDKNWKIIVSENTKTNLSEYTVSDKLKDNAIYYWRIRAHYPSNIWGVWSSKEWFAINIERWEGSREVQDYFTRLINSYWRNRLLLQGAEAVVAPLIENFGFDIDELIPANRGREKGVAYYTLSGSYNYKNISYHVEVHLQFKEWPSDYFFSYVLVD